MSNIKKSRSNRGRKLSNFVSNPKSDSVGRGEPEVIVVEVRPLLVGHMDVFPQNVLGIFVKENGTLHESSNGLGVCRLCGGLSSVDHECSVRANLPMACSQIGDDGYRANGSHVVKGEIDLQRTKEVIQTHALAYTTTTGLKQHMHFGNSVERCGAEAIQNSLNCVLIQHACKDGMYLRRQI